MKTNDGRTVFNDLNVMRQQFKPAFRRSLSRPGVQFLLFFVFVVALNWPILSICDGFVSYRASFIYLFTLWSIVIVVLLVVSRCCLKHQFSSKTMPKEQSPGC